MLEFHGICFYIPQGPDEPTAGDIAFWSDYMVAARDTTGSTSGSYRAESVARAAIRGLPNKPGPTFGVYDPELAAMIGAEL